MSPVNYYFALSHELRRAYCQRYAVSEKRVLIKENGVDLVRFRPAADEEKKALRASLGLPITGEMVLFCGSVIHRKGVDLLLRAWKSVQAVHPSAILVLRGSFGYRPTYESNGLSNALCAFTSEIHRLHESLPNPGNVFFAGHGADMESYYRAANLFVFPSRLEGLPYVLFEAMACGLPCVIAPFVGMPREGEELGNLGTHYLTCSHEPESISTQVIDALKNPGRLTGIGEASRRWMEKTQDLEIVADKLASSFRFAAGL